jgi:hypothetical protein
MKCLWMKACARWWYGGCLFENCQHQTMLLFLNFCSSFVLSPQCVALPMCIAANCSWSFAFCVIILCVSLLRHVYCCLTYYSCRIAG